MTTETRYDQESKAEKMAAANADTRSFFGDELYEKTRANMRKDMLAGRSYRRCTMGMSFAISGYPVCAMWYDLVQEIDLESMIVMPDETMLHWQSPEKGRVTIKMNDLVTMEKSDLDSLIESLIKISETLG